MTGCRGHVNSAPKPIIAIMGQDDPPANKGVGDDWRLPFDNITISNGYKGRAWVEVQSVQEAAVGLVNLDLVRW